MVQRLHALLALGAQGCLGAGLQGDVGRSRLRIRAHRRHLYPGPSAWHRRKRGTQNQAIGKSRGGLTTKIAALVDALGNLLRFVLLPGQRHDITSFDVLMAGVPCLALIGDKARSMRTGCANIWPAATLRRSFRCAKAPLDIRRTTRKSTSGAT